MCACDPTIRTPFCGRVKCRWPDDSNIAPSSPARRYELDTLLRQAPFKDDLDMINALAFCLGQLIGKISAVKERSQLGRVYLAAYGYENFDDLMSELMRLTRVFYEMPTRYPSVDPSHYQFMPPQT